MAATPPMVPTIVMRNGRVDLVLGSPGGERGVAAVVQVLQGTVDLQHLPVRHHDLVRVDPGDVLGPDHRERADRTGPRGWVVDLDGRVLREAV